MPRRISWPKVKRIWWCSSCNIPILQSTCPRCGAVSRRLPLSDPGDARPAFERDYRSLYQAYLYEFGTDKGFSDVVGRSVALLNKAPYYDEMKEVIVDGVHIGRLYFDPLARRWRFRLSRHTALKLYTSYPDLLEVAVVNKRKCMYGDTLRVDRDIERGRQVVLVDKAGSVVGIGYSRGRGRIMVHSWWAPQQRTSDIGVCDSYRKSDLSDVINAHKDYVRMISARAKKFIAITHSKIRRPTIVSFSGGKDSLVSLHLALDLGLDPVVLFNNTGIELPETVDTVHRVVDRYGLRLIEASAGDRFWSAVYELGIPGRDYRWCCKVCKLAPLALAVKQMWDSGGLNIVGQRAFESIDRARSPRVWRLRWAPMLLNLSPINEWSQFEVWLYIFTHNLDVNPLYFMGYERIGCFMCPASTMAELDLVSQTHRDLWGRWLSVLEYWAKRLDLPREWIDYGLWRWNTPARYRTMIAKRLKVHERVDNWSKTFKNMISPAIVEIEKSENRSRVTLEREVDVECLASQVAVLGPDSFSIDSSRSYAEIAWGEDAVIVSGRSIEARYTDAKEGIERLVDALKLVYRWSLCTGCRSCETICSSGATQIKMLGGRTRPTVDKSKCISCKFCIYNCPVAEVFVEHVVTPVVFSDPEAWRRETREHHDEVLEKIRSFIKSSTPITRPEPTARDDQLSDVSSFFNTSSS